MTQASIHENLERHTPLEVGSPRSFGLVFAAVSLVVAVLPIVRGNPVRIWAGVVAGLFLGVALIAPALLQPLNRAWMRFGETVGRIVALGVMALIFFVVITPMGAWLRITRRDLLRLRREPAARTYWIERNPAGPAPETMVNQF
jgi:saxitoxin biosynthesis operon SxtJ-like protein